MVSQSEGGVGEAGGLPPPPSLTAHCHQQGSWLAAMAGAGDPLVLVTPLFWARSGLAVATQLWLWPFHCGAMAWVDGGLGGGSSIGRWIGAVRMDWSSEGPPDWLS